LFVCFLAQTLTAEQLFRQQSLNTILQADLTLSKVYEQKVLTSRINYQVVGNKNQRRIRMHDTCAMFLASRFVYRQINQCI
jgi:hypothetical protein